MSWDEEIHFFLRKILSGKNNVKLNLNQTDLLFSCNSLLSDDSSPEKGCGEMHWRSVVLDNVEPIKVSLLLKPVFNRIKNVNTAS